MIKEFYFRTFKCLDAKISIGTNYQSILYDEEYFSGKGTHLHSLLSNFYKLEEISSEDLGDTLLMIINRPGKPLTVEGCGNNIYVQGDIKTLESKTDDKRKTIFGNMGFFSKLIIRALERKNIFSLHAVSLIEPESNRLILVLGESGSGKSSVMLEGLQKGYKLFGAELTHFSICDNQIIFYKGALAANCRVGNLVEDFPEFTKRFSLKDLPSENLWESYRSLDMSMFQSENDSLADPEVVLVFPRIEAKRNPAVITSIKVKEMAVAVFNNLCEKVSSPSFIYNTYLIPSIDPAELQERRMDSALEFCRIINSETGYKILSAPGKCLDEIVAL